MMINGNPDEARSVADQGLNFTLPSVTLARSLNAKVQKVLEESAEVAEELDELGQVDPERAEPLAKELIDVMISAQSALNHMNEMGVPVQQMIDAVFAKNDARGYYTPGGIPYVRDQQAST